MKQRSHHAPLPAPKPAVQNSTDAPRWRVERAGREGDYSPGWFAYNRDGFGAWFPTWLEAFAFAIRQATPTTPAVVKHRGAPLEVDVMEPCS